MDIRGHRRRCRDFRSDYGPGCSTRQLAALTCDSVADARHADDLDIAWRPLDYRFERRAGSVLRVASAVVLAACFDSGRSRRDAPEHAAEARVRTCQTAFRRSYRVAGHV